MKGNVPVTGGLTQDWFNSGSILAQVWLGKIPCKAMMKLSVRNGCMLLCGWLPPTAVTDWGFSVVLAALLVNELLLDPLMKLFVALSRLGGRLEATI